MLFVFIEGKAFFISHLKTIVKTKRCLLLQTPASESPSFQDFLNAIVYFFLPDVGQGNSQIMPKVIKVFTAWTKTSDIIFSCYPFSHS